MNFRTHTDKIRILSIYVKRAWKRDERWISYICEKEKVHRGFGDVIAEIQVDVLSFTLCFPNTQVLSASGGTKGRLSI